MHTLALRRSSVFVCTVLLAATVAVPQQRRRPSEAAELEDLLGRYAAFGFQGSVLVARDGEVVLARGCGLADPRTGRTNDERTLFEIASLTKQFTAAAILLLEEDGKLSTEDGIAEHLPGVPEHSRAITIHHLLTHTSGVPGSNARGAGDDLAAAVTAFLGDGPQRPLGERYEYWNGGYSLLAGIVEQVSGQTFMEFCRRRLFEPAGMTDTGFTGDTHLDAARAAVGDTERPRSALDHPYGSYGWQYRGMGGAVTTVLDLLKWDRALRDDTVLSAESRKKLFEPQVEMIGRGAEYAYGWQISEGPGGRRRIHHGGSVRGFLCDFRRYEEPAVCIAVLTNANDMALPYIVENLDCVALGARPRHPLPPEVVALSADELEGYAGTYVADPAGRVIVRSSGGGLVLGLEGQQVLDEVGQRSPFDLHPRLTQRAAGAATRAVAIIEAIARGDAGPLRDAMADRIPAGWPDTVVAQLWPRHRDAHGALEGVRAIGATSSGARTTVVLALEHSRRPSRVRIEFRGEDLEILDWNGPEFAATVRAMPTGKDTFTAWAWHGTKEYRFVRTRDEWSLHAGDLVLRHEQGR